MYKIYLLDICDLEDVSLREKAIALIDDHRKMLADKCLKEKDRVRAIAAGLLLQAGFWELEPLCEGCERQELIIGEQKMSLSGVCFKMQAKGLVQHLHDFSRNQSEMPVQLSYKVGAHGKPLWDKEVMEATFGFKKLWHFSLSHSGDYVVLMISDMEVGIDIQEPREVQRFPGGFRAFSRMEAYVKCTGEGYARGYGMYQKHQGNVFGYEIQSIDIIEQYAIYICFDTRKAIGNTGE